MGTAKGVTWPAMEEMWIIALGFDAETGDEDKARGERKWEIASWVVRMGWARFMAREA